MSCWDKAGELTASNYNTWIKTEKYFSDEMRKNVHITYFIATGFCQEKKQFLY